MNSSIRPVCLLLFSVFVGVVRSSDIPEQYVEDLCEEYNDGLDCCVGLVAPTPCPTSADCPAVATPEPTAEPCPTADAATPCPTFSPPSPCPTLAANVCDTCDTLTEECKWNEVDDTLECACKTGHARTNEGGCEYAQAIWDFYSAGVSSELILEFKETDGVIDDYSIYLQVDYVAPFNLTINQDYKPFETVVPIIAEVNDPSKRWPLLNAIPKHLFGGNTDFRTRTVAQLEFFNQDGGEFGLYYLLYETPGIEFDSLDASSIKEIRDSLFAGNTLYLSMGSTVNSTDFLTYQQTLDIGPRNRQIFYSPQERTNYANAQCFHDAQCDLAYSTCGGFDPAFPDTPGACVCTHGALVDGSCPPALACDPAVTGGDCGINVGKTRRIVGTGGVTYEVQCLADSVNVNRDDPISKTAAYYDKASIDIKYTYSTSFETRITVDFPAATFADNDAYEAHIRANWTITADLFLFDNAVFTPNPYKFTEGVELARVSSPAAGTLRLDYILQFGTSLMTESEIASLAGHIFDRGGAALYSDITIFTGVDDGNRYITADCDASRLEIRDSDVDCYFLTETECAGGCDYATVDSIICDPDTGYMEEPPR